VNNHELQVCGLELTSEQFLWTLLIMALVGNMIHDALGGNPSIVNYDMFAAVFSMLSLFYLVPVAIKEEFAFHPLIAIVLDFFNTLFFLCGAIAMAGYLGVHSCGNQVSFIPDKTTIVTKLKQFS
jgi:hypothetical protein